MNINLRIVSPHLIVRSTTTQQVIIPGVNGQIGVLENHGNLVSALETGIVKIKVDNKWTPLIIAGGGMVEIYRNFVTVVAPDAEHVPPKIDLKEAMAGVDKAKVNLKKVEDFVKSQNPATRQEELKLERILLDATVAVKKAKAMVDVRDYLLLLKS